MNIVPSPTGLNQFKLVNGLIFGRGYVNQAFVQSEPGQTNIEQSVELDQPLVLVVADKITRVEQVLPVLELVKEMKKPLLLVSEDLREDPASTMVYNNKSGNVQCCAVNFPWSGGTEKDHLKDIAVLTGATLIDNEHVLRLEEVTKEHFGRAQFIKVTEFETSIVDGGGEPQAIEERVGEIRRQIKDESKQLMKNLHSERLSRMQSKIAEI
mmetsp:Transcript_11337/g.19097  ORF Transcript_11337/g.19097 Transcript_11337/m.19097 type:complete len:211 (+) Transcript_11337:687-1319(+)